MIKKEHLLHDFALTSQAVSLDVVTCWNCMLPFFIILDWICSLCMRCVDIQWDVSAAMGQHGVRVGMWETEAADGARRLGWWNSRLSAGIRCELLKQEEASTHKSAKTHQCVGDLW